MTGSFEVTASPYHAYCGTCSADADFDTFTSARSSGVQLSLARLGFTYVTAKLCRTGGASPAWGAKFQCIQSVNGPVSVFLHAGAAAIAAKEDKVSQT